MLLFKYNKFKVNNLYDFEHIIKINNIFDIKNDLIINSKENNNGNILITQEFNEENYGLLIIANIKEIDYAIFIQICIDKNEKEIKWIKDELSC